jgi:hypothetical protein
MRKTKISTLLALTLVFGMLSCTKEQKAEVPKQEQITKDLVPAQAEAKGQDFSVTLSGLKVAESVNTASKEIVETPNLSANIKITNTSKDILNIQGVTLEYLDETGKPIPFKSGEKFSNVSAYWQPIKPHENFEGSIDTTIPRAAVAEKALGKIEINVVYVPTPLKQETLTLPEKLEGPQA